MRTSILLCIAAAVGLLAPSVAAPAWAQVSFEDQASTFVRIFAFDRSLSGAVITVLLVESDEAPGELDGIRDSFAQQGVTVLTTTLSSLATDVASASVVYFAANTATPAAAALVSGAGALSLSGVAAHAENGLVSVAAESLGERTGLVVNRPRLREERHELDTQLLKQPWVRVVTGSQAAASSSLESCQVTQFAEPTYPTHARRLGIEGTVTVRVLVNDSGRVDAVEVVESVPALENTAVRAAERSRYSTPGWCVLRIPFKLEAE